MRSFLDEKRTVQRISVVSTLLFFETRIFWIGQLFARHVSTPYDPADLPKRTRCPSRTDPLCSSRAHARHVPTESQSDLSGHALNRQLEVNPMNKTRKTGAEIKSADKMRNLIVTVSKSMEDQLTADESRKVFMAVLEKMQQPSPKGNVWEFEAVGHRFRGVLKRDYVLPGEDVVSLYMQRNAQAPKRKRRR